MEKRVVFGHKTLPYLLLLPQIVITVVFFFLPAGQAMWQSMRLEDAFGLSSEFVGIDNFVELFKQQAYLDSFRVTAVFSVLVAVVGLGVSLLLAVMADRVIRGAGLYKTLLIWPYAVAPAVVGVLWLFMFSPSVGILAVALNHSGVNWNPRLNGNQAMMLVLIAAVWKQVSYNFLFFLAGLQSIPRSLIEAAAIDGASPATLLEHRLPAAVAHHVLPAGGQHHLCVLRHLRRGGHHHAGRPGTSTSILVYKVYSDGFRGLDLGSSAAQSVVLMFIVIALTVVQFRYVDRKVQY